MVSGGRPRLTGCRQSNTTGTNRQREDLANKNPSTRAPSCAEEKDEDGDERDLSVDGSGVVGAYHISTISANDSVSLVEAGGDTNDADDELRMVRE